MKDKISIVIPIYNSELYLDECIKSTINQTYKNLEIILINDGSKDKSLNICKKYKKIDNRIKVIDNKRNMGVSYSRNKGLENAKGKYIMFLDSDDYFSYDYVSKMYNAISYNKCDIVISGFRCFSKEKEQIIQYVNEDKVLEFDLILDDIINTCYFNSVSKTIINSDVIKNNDIWFDTSLNYFEDYKFSFIVMKNSKKIMYLSNCLYNYRINESSSTRKFSCDKILKWFDNDNSVIDYIFSNVNIKDTANRKFTKLNVTLCMLSKIDGIKYKEFKKYSKILIEKFYNSVSKNDIDIKKIDYETKINKIRMKMIFKNHLKSFYILSKLVKIFK